MSHTLAIVMASGKKPSAETIHRKLGKRLAYFRKLRNLNQRELAERVGVVQVVVSDYETGKLRLTAEMALRFAAALDVPIQQLLNTGNPLPIEPPPQPSRRILQRLEQIERLPRRKQEALMLTIDTFLKSTSEKAS
jgi:transcriptional regulator with XRE-family HTH domain